MPEPVQSVLRAFDILRLLQSADGSMPLSELADGVGLPKSTTRRLLATLEMVGAVERGSHGSYTMGLLPDGDSSTSNLRAVAAPFLRDIVGLTGEDATLAILDRDTAIILDQVPGPNPIQVPEGRGLRFAPHEISSGLALMAGWDARSLEQYLDERDLDRHHRGHIREQVQTARRKGYVWHVDGWVPGVSAVAAPVSTPDGVVIASIGAFGATYRFPGTNDPDAIGASLADMAKMLRRRIA